MHLFLVSKSLFLFCIAFVVNFLKPVKDDYVLIGSNYGGRIDPNASCLNEHIKKEGKKVYLISNVSGMKDWLRFPRGSFKSFRLFLGAKSVFYTHSLSDVLPFAHKLSFLKKCMNFPKLIFLQHGVVGLKNTMPNGQPLGTYIRSLEATFDFMIVSSNWEKEIVMEMGIAPTKIAITGLPRFDSYFVKNKLVRKALVFFTWQNENDLSEKLKDILDSDLATMLEEKDYLYNFATHDMQLGEHEIPNSKEEGLTKALENCSLLITDDSSIAWDIFYQGGEVIFYKPSDNWLLERDYLEVRKCFGINQLNQRVDKVLNLESFERVNFTEFGDTKNCERVYSLVNS